MTDHELSQDDIDSLLIGKPDGGMPPEVEQRLRVHLAQFRKRLEEGNGISSKENDTAGRSHRRLWYSLAALATCVSAIAIAALFLTQAPAWADVVRSVEQRPWIHCQLIAPKEQSIEFWFSHTTENHTLAARFGDTDFAMFVDLEHSQEMSYRKQEGQILRQPFVNTAVPDLGIANMFVITLAPHDQMSQQLNRDANLLSVSQERVTHEGQSWMQYRLVFEETRGRHDQYIDTYLVDEVTSLPRWWTRSSPDGQKVLRFKIDYPASGPLDIFDIGVSKSIPVIDR